MPNLTILNASPRKNGFTSQMIDAFLSVCTTDAVIHNIYDKKIAPCTGCDCCKNSGKCIIKDDMDKITADIFSSDYIVFATPVYNYSFPAPMKAFLDRLQPFFSDEKYKNPASDRKGFVLASCGKSGKFSLDVIEKQSRIAFSELSASFEGIYMLTNTDDKQDCLQDDEINKVKQLANEFFFKAF